MDLNILLADPFQKTKRQVKFEHQRKDYTDKQLMLELLYSQKLQLDMMDRVRSNTQTLVICLIVIPAIFGVLAFLIGMAF